MNDKYISENAANNHITKNPVLDDKSLSLAAREGRDESKKERLAKALRDNLKRRKRADFKD